MFFWFCGQICGIHDKFCFKNMFAQAASRAARYAQWRQGKSKGVENRLQKLVPRRKGSGEGRGGMKRREAFRIAMQVRYFQSILFSHINTVQIEKGVAMRFMVS